MAGVGLLGGAAVATTGNATAQSGDLPTTIVFDGTNASGQADYEFGVSGAVEPHGDVGALESEDTIDGTHVVGVLNGDVDAYRYSGSLTLLDVSGAVDVSISYTDPTAIDADRLEIVSASGTSLDYAFTATGEVQRVLENGDNSAETGNDAIDQNDDGTWTVDGFTGEGFGDTFDVYGDVTSFEPVTGEYTLFLNGSEVTLAELTGRERPDDDDGSDSRVLEIVTLTDGSLDYSFTATEEVERLLDYGDNSAEMGNDVIVQNDDGTWTVDGFTGEGFGDAFRFAGEIASFAPMAGDFALVLDGSQVSPYELTGQEEPEADVVIDFGDQSYLDDFTQTYRTGQLSLVSDDRARTDTSLRVGIVDGQHYGTSMRYRFADAGMSEPDTLYYRYNVCFPTDFEVIRTGGKLPGPAGTYDTAGWGGRQADGTNGWSARMAFDNGSTSDHVQVGWYCYHADMGSWGSRWDWTRDGRGDLEKGQWYQIDGQVTMNTPGENDGVLRGWVDGQLAHEKTDVRFRDTSDIRVQDFWFNVYYGGSWSAPSDSAVYFDDLMLSLGSPI